MERKKTKFEYTNTLDKARMKIKFLVIECANYIRKQIKAYRVSKSTFPTQPILAIPWIKPCNLVVPILKIKKIYIYIY